MTVSGAAAFRPGGDGAEDGADFAAADSQAAFLAGLMAALAASFPGLHRIAVMAEDTSGENFRPVALWPDPQGEVAALGAVVAEALETEGPALTGAGGDLRAARAIRFEDRPVAVLALSGALPADVARRALALGSGWIAARLWERRASTDRARFERSFAALDMLAVAAEQRGVPATALSLVNELTSLLPVQRAGLGLIRAGRPNPRLVALSGAAWFRRRGSLVRALEDAMGEAVDQMETVAAPVPPDRPQMVDTAQREVRDLTGAGAVASVVLFDEAVPVGAILVESDAAIGDETLKQLEAVAALIGPVIGLKARQHALIAGRLPELAGRGLRALFGRHRVSYRIAAVAILLALGLPFVLTGTLTVTADATLEGRVQQAAVAPFDSFIRTAPTRPGAQVAADDVLLTLEERDLMLEAEKWRNDLRRLDQEARQALMEGDPSERALLAARRAKAEAELALAVGRLERTRIRAPLSGRVISGDHRQRIGAPVRAGDLLYEIASDNDFRVVVDVDERDLSLVAPGQPGRLVLSAETDRGLPIEVTGITPVARTEEGERLFEAEARLLDTPDRLLPGMQGVVRLQAGEKSLARIWTRRLRDWLRMQIWRWSP